MIRIFNERKLNDESNAPVLIEAMKFIDFSMVILPEEFQIYKWIFISDQNINLENNNLLQILFVPYLDSLIDLNLIEISDHLFNENELSLNLRKPIDTIQIKPNTKGVQLLATKLSCKFRQSQLFKATTNADSNAESVDIQRVNELLQYDFSELTEEELKLLNDGPPKEDNWVLITKK